MTSAARYRRSAATIRLAGRGPAPTITPLSLLSSALDRGVDEQVLSQLIGLHERSLADEERRAFETALTAAKAELPVIAKTQIASIGSLTGRIDLIIVACQREGQELTEIIGEPAGLARQEHLPRLEARGLRHQPGLLIDPRLLEQRMQRTGTPQVLRQRPTELGILDQRCVNRMRHGELDHLAAQLRRFPAPPDKVDQVIALPDCPQTIPTDQSECSFWVEAVSQDATFRSNAAGRSS